MIAAFFNQSHTNVGNMGIKIRHEPPSQRRSFRITFPIIVNIGGKNFETLDWSMTGVRIGGFNHPIQKGQDLEAKITVPFQGYDFSFDCQMVVADIKPDQGIVAAEFIDLGEPEQDVLRTFFNGLMSGEMEPIGGVIRRIDVPVTPVSLKPDQNLSAEDVERKRQRGTSLYMAAGAAFTVLFLIVLYTNVFQMKILSSVVMAPSDTILSPTSGDITFVAEKAPAIVKAGEPIIKMVDLRLERDITLANLRIQEAELDVKRAEQSYASELQRVDASKGIVSKEYEAATARLRSLESTLQLKQAAIDRGEGLIQHGFISIGRMDQLKSDYLATEQELNVAKQEAVKLRETLSSVNKGFQVREQRVEGGMADLDSLRKSSVERLATAQAERDFLIEQRERLVIKAPTDGKLVKVFTPANSSVKYGDTIAIFEKQGDKFVQSFLAHEEAVKVKLGDPVDVYFPKMWISASFKVKDVDYYSLSVNQNAGHFVWQDEKQKSVIVTLEPINTSSKNKIVNIAPGTAATAIFSTLF